MPKIANEIVESLWFRIHSLLVEFENKLTRIQPELIHDVGRSKTDAFPLRAFLAFRRRNDGEEIAITIDLYERYEKIIIEASSCKDDGKIIAMGPSSALLTSDKGLSVEIEIDGWLSQFEQWLIGIQSSVALECSSLT
jgi:hypothetical protein